MEITGVNRELQTVSNINGYQGSSVNNTGYKNAGSGMDQTGGIAANVIKIRKFESLEQIL